MYENAMASQQNAMAEYWNRKAIDTNMSVAKEWQLNEAKLARVFDTFSLIV